MLRLPNFFPFSLSRAVSIAFSTCRSGMSPYNESFVPRTDSDISGRYFGLADAFAASYAPLSKCIPPQQPEGLWFLCLHTHPRARKSCALCISQETVTVNHWWSSSRFHCAAFILLESDVFVRHLCPWSVLFSQKGFREVTVRES